MTYKQVASNLVLTKGAAGTQIEYSQPVRRTGANAVQAVVKTLHANPVSPLATAYIQTGSDLDNWTDRASVAINDLAAASVSAISIADAYARLRYQVDAASGATVILAADMNTYSA